MPHRQQAAHPPHHPLTITRHQPLRCLLLFPLTSPVTIRRSSGDPHEMFTTILRAERDGVCVVQWHRHCEQRAPLAPALAPHRNRYALPLREWNWRDSMSEWRARCALQCRQTYTRPSRRSSCSRPIRVRGHRPRPPTGGTPGHREEPRLLKASLEPHDTAGKPGRRDGVKDASLGPRHPGCLGQGRNVSPRGEESRPRIGPADIIYARSLGDAWLGACRPHRAGPTRHLVVPRARRPRPPEKAPADLNVKYRAVVMVDAASRSRKIDIHGEPARLGEEMR